MTLPKVAALVVVAITVSTSTGGATPQPVERQTGLRRRGHGQRQKPRRRTKAGA